MAVKIQIRRGAKNNLPDLDEGELGFATDTKEVFIGTATAENVQILTGTAGVSPEAIVAQTLKTPRTITLSGDVTGSFTFDGSQALSVTTEVVNDSHTHDTRYYTETELNAGQLNNLYYTETELNAGQLDNRYYTETESNTLLNAKAPLVSPVFTGTPTAPTAVTSTNSTQIATTEFVQDVLLQANATIAEWSFLEKITNTEQNQGSILISRDFDTDTYDYKFVVDADTNAEDNDSVKIQLNQNTSNVYQYLVTQTRVDLEPNNYVISQNFSFANDAGGRPEAVPSAWIPSFVNLRPESTQVDVTRIHLEFVVSQGYGTGTFGVKSLSVKGEGTALGIKAPVSGQLILPSVSTFLGFIQAQAGLTDVTIIHDITAGTTDNSVVRIYRRLK
jgi:hypothetical protein